SPFTPTRLADGFGEGVTGSQRFGFYTPEGLWVPRSKAEPEPRFRFGKHSCTTPATSRALNVRKFPGQDRPLGTPAPRRARSPPAGPNAHKACRAEYQGRSSP